MKNSFETIQRSPDNSDGETRVILKQDVENMEKEAEKAMQSHNYDEAALIYEKLGDINKLNYVGDRSLELYKKTVTQNGATRRYYEFAVQSYKAADNKEKLNEMAELMMKGDGIGGNLLLASKVFQYAGNMEKVEDLKEQLIKEGHDYIREKSSIGADWQYLPGEAAGMRLRLYENAEEYFEAASDLSGLDEVKRFYSLNGYQKPLERIEKIIEKIKNLELVN